MTDSRDALRREMIYNARSKSAPVSYLLWFFLGYFGAHRFYLGRAGSGVAQLTLWLLGWPLLVMFGAGLILWGVLAIWWVADAFLIPGMIEEENVKLVDRLAAPGGY